MKNNHLYSNNEFIYLLINIYLLMIINNIYNGWLIDSRNTLFKEKPKKINYLLKITYISVIIYIKLQLFIRESKNKLNIITDEKNNDKDKSKRD